MSYYQRLIKSIFLYKMQFLSHLIYMNLFQNTICIKHLWLGRRYVIMFILKT